MKAGSVPGLDDRTLLLLQAGLGQSTEGVAMRLTDLVGKHSVVTGLEPLVPHSWYSKQHKCFVILT